jgi:hypothetical protein
MTTIILFIGIIIGLNCVPFLTKKTFPKVEKVIVNILIASTILFLTFISFEFSGYSLKGHYTFSTIGMTFIISTILYFTIIKNSKRKILIVFLLTPLVVLSIVTLILGRTVYERKIDETNKVVVTTGGFLACGENIGITQSRFGIFDKEVFHFDNLCLIGVHKIETLKLDDKHVEFSIYHNGKYDSENPYKYDVERKNVW